MGDDNSVLAQSEIDALFKPAIEKSAASAPARSAASGGRSSPKGAPAAAQPRVAASRGTGSVVAETVAPSPSSDTIKALQASLADLAQRITKVEMSVRQLSQREQPEQGVADVAPVVQQLSKKLPAVMKELQKVNDQVRGIERGLAATPDYGVRKDFTCSSCGSHGFVAIPMKCTKCGSEGWWGWWPKT